MKVTKEIVETHDLGCNLQMKVIYEDIGCGSAPPSGYEWDDSFDTPVVKMTIYLPCCSRSDKLHPTLVANNVQLFGEFLDCDWGSYASLNRTRFKSKSYQRSTVLESFEKAKGDAAAAKTALSRLVQRRLSRLERRNETIMLARADSPFVREVPDETEERLS